MGFQIWALVEAAIAHRAFVRRLFHVEGLVHGQCARLAKTFATFSAFEWLFFRMDKSVEEKDRKINHIIEGLEKFPILLQMCSDVRTVRCMRFRRERCTCKHFLLTIYFA